MLIQQIHQQSNSIFTQLLQRAQMKTLTQADILILNEKIVTSLTLSDLLNNINYRAM